MAEVGWANLAIKPSFDGFAGELERGSSKHLAAAGESGGKAFGDTAGKSAGRRFGGVFKTAAKASLVGLAGVAAGAFKLGKDSIGLASDLGESLNAVNVTYEGQSRAVRKLGREAAESLGLSNTEFNSLSVRFAGFSKTIAGGEGKKVVSTLDDLTTRAADFASVMNLEVNEAAELFQSGLAGETEPLRRYGLDLSAAAVQAHALAVGIADGKGELTEAEKVQGRYSLLMEQTAKTQGDFANTSDSLANRQRILNARWDDARAKLGQGLLPYMEAVSGWILDKGLPAFEDFSGWFNKKGLPAIQNFADDLRPLVDDTLPVFADVLGTARDVLGEAVPYARRLVEAFNDMPDWAKTAIVTGGGALAIGSKFGLNRAAGKAVGGAAGALVRSAKPIPVFVVNEGFGGTGGGVAGGKPSKWGKVGRLGGVAAGAAGVGFLAEPLITGDKSSADRWREGNPGGMFGAGGVQGMIRDGEKLREVLNGNHAAARNMNSELTRKIKLTVDNLPVKQAQREVERLITLMETANTMNNRIMGAQATHNRKLYGDSYGGGGAGSGGGVNIRIDKVEAKSGGSFMDDMRSRAGRAIGGVQP